MGTNVEISKKRKEWVNKEFGRLTSGTSMKTSQKAKLLKKLWREAKRDIR